MGNRVILLVEDNPDDLELAMRAFARHNFANDVVVVRDGAAALDYLFARGAFAGRDATALPAVMLLDLKLPKVDGLEVLRQVRANPVTTLLPVVILTSSKEDSDVLNGYRLRTNSYIRKPVDFEQFAQSVRDLHLYWLVLNEPPPPSGGATGQAG